MPQNVRLGKQKCLQVRNLRTMLANRSDKNNEKYISLESVGRTNFQTLKYGGTCRSLLHDVLYLRGTLDLLIYISPAHPSGRRPSLTGDRS